jgi:hypothetical protein
MILPGEYDHLVRGIFGCASHNMDVQKLQEFSGGIQKRGRIVIAGCHNNVAIRRSSNAAQKAIIQLLCVVAWGATVKHITCYQQHIDTLFLYGIRQPIQKGLTLFISLATMKGTADVPVRSVEEFHVFLPWKIV